jgi:hypothetical protein
VIRTNGQQHDPALRIFLAHLQVLTEIDEEALTRWMVQHHEQLKVGFAQSRRPPDEVRVWVREQYVRSLGVTS